MSKDVSISVTSNEFENLGRSFQDILDTLDSDDHLQKFRKEYIRLYQALEKSIGNEKTLHEKCIELNNEIVKNASKIDCAMKLSEDDQITIEKLMAEIHKAWDMVESSNDKYKVSQGIIKNLSDQINQLNETISKGNESRAGKDRELKELMEKKDHIEEKKFHKKREKRLLEEEKLAIERQCRNEQMSFQELSNRYETLVKSVGKVENEYNSVDNGIMMNTMSANEIRKELKSKRALLLDINSKLKQETVSLQTLQSKLKREVQKTSSLSKKYDELTKNVLIYKEQLDQERNINNNLARVHKQAREELLNERLQKKDLSNKLEGEKKRYVRLLLDKKRLLKKNETLIEGTEGVMHKIEIVKMENEETTEKWKEDKRKIAKHENEKNSLKVNVVDSLKKVRKNKQVLNQSGMVQLKMKQKIAVVMNEISGKKKRIQQIENDRENYSRDASESMKNYMKAMEIVKVKKLHNRELQKRINEQKEELKTQQKKYEQVRIDRNNFNRGLVESNEEIAFLKRKFDIMAQQMEQLSDDISNSDNNLSTKEQEKKKLFDINSKQVIDITNLDNELKGKIEGLDKFKQESSKLKDMVNEIDDKRKKQRKQLQTVTTARDILGTQLIRRNDELALLHEKVKIQDGILRQGNVELSFRKRELNMLQLKSKQIQRDLLLMKKEISNILKYKKKCVEMKQKIVDEKMKVRALSEELEDPKKVDRWRKLKGKQETNSEMTARIQKFQKRLIHKTQTIMEKKIEIEKKEKILTQLVEIRKKQPSNDDIQRLNNLQDSIRKQKNSMKTLTSEINMQVYLEKKQKYQLDSLEKELAELRKEVFVHKKNAK